MIKYTYDDFLATLEEADKHFLNAINEYISCYYPDYKSYDIRPKNKLNKEWTINYRKKPKVGKPICNVYSIDRKLSIQFVFLTSKMHEVLLRQEEFSGKMRHNILKQSLCVANLSCRTYGNQIGANGCAWRQYFWIKHRLIMTCPYPYIHISDIIDGDLSDLQKLIDLQMKHMTQDAKDIKGNGYVEINKARCGEVKILSRGQIDVDIDTFNISDYCMNPKRLEKYASLYNLVPMGEDDGIWFYQSDEAVCGIDCSKSEFCFTRIPQGRYATVTVDNPMTFSLCRTWNYICKWAQENLENINEIELDGVKATCLVKFYMEYGKEYMTMHVPIKQKI